MPRLGLGLGLSRGSQLKTFAQLVKSAGGVLYLDARKADGSGPLTGNQSPFVDLSGDSNDGTLTNFAGTGTSGWQASPNVLRFDGVDDFVQFADTASLDITNAPLAIGVTFKPTNDTGYLVSKNSGTSNFQYAVASISGLNVYLYNETGQEAGTSIPTIIDEYVNVVYFYDGVNIKGYKNNNNVFDIIRTLNLASQGPGLLLGCRDAVGSQAAFLSSDIATVTIYTGSDINKILKAEAKISAEYLALNP